MIMAEYPPNTGYHLARSGDLVAEPDNASSDHAPPSSTYYQMDSGYWQQPPGMFDPSTSSYYSAANVVTCESQPMVSFEPARSSSAYYNYDVYGYAEPAQAFMPSVDPNVSYECYGPENLVGGAYESLPQSLSHPTCAPALTSAVPLAPASQSPMPSQSHINLPSASSTPALFTTGVAKSSSSKSNRSSHVNEQVRLSRLEARRKRNREAAQRCRTNRIETIKRLERQRSELLEQIELLRSLASQVDPQVKQLDATYQELTERHFCQIPFKKES